MNIKARSKGKVLGPSFFNRPTLEVAEDLLGKYLVRKWRGKEIALPIWETEAYDGFDDLASHASRGKTARTQVMFGEPGIWYCYLVYGMHWMINIVTGPKDYPAAVLIRAAGDIIGPARLTKKLNITGRENCKRAEPESGLWIEDRGVKIKKSAIAKLPRVGVSYAGEWAKKEWRFLYENIH